jgi:biotin/methionine sulfoxide reductase
VAKSTTSRHQHSAHWGAFQAVVEDGRFTGVEAFAGDQKPSPISQALPDAVYNSARIAHPMVRRSWLEHGPGTASEKRGADPFVQVSWEQALALVGDEIERVKDNFGNAAIFAGSYGWGSAGRFHHPNTLVKRFFNTIGGFTNQSGNYSVGAGLILLPYVVGTTRATGGPLTSWDSIAQDTELFVSFGGLPLKNAQVADGGIANHSIEGWQRQAKESGVRFVNVSPNKADCADFLQAQWVAPRPNTDVALMLGLAHTLASEGLLDNKFLDRYTTGYQRFSAYLMGSVDGTVRDAQWASQICDVPADVICTLAREMASHRTMLNTNLSLQRGDHGEQPFWMTIVLASMLGQIGLPGGGFGLGYGSISGMGVPMTEIPALRMSAGSKAIDSSIPVARFVDMLLNPGASIDWNGRTVVYPDTKMIYWAGGNPFSHHQDINRMISGFQRPDTIVVHEPWWTPMARMADVVLPVTTSLERNDIGASTRDRFFMKMSQAIEPVGEARNDFDVFAALAERFGTLEAFTEGRDEMAWLRHLYDGSRQGAHAAGVELPDFDEFWEIGHAEVPAPTEPFVMFADFRADPDANPLKTPSGKIEIFSQTIDDFNYDDCPGHPTWLEPAEWLGADIAEDYPLHILSNQPKARLHSQLDCAQVSRASKIQDREAVWINTADAADRGISEGEVVRIFNVRGELLAGAHVTDEMRSGVLQLPTGAWYDPLQPGVPGTLDIHGNPNVVTLDKGTSKLTQAPVAQTALVQLERFEGPLPEIKAFAPPAA